MTRSIMRATQTAALILVTMPVIVAAEAMLKHKSLAEPLIAKFEMPAARAMDVLSGQNARRLAMMADDGELAALGQTPALLETVAKYGDRAMDFVWRNKGSLAVGAAL